MAVERPTARIDGPAIIHYDLDGKTIESEYWFLNDYKHRIDGPAEIHYGLDGKTIEYWWIGGLVV